MSRYPKWWNSTITVYNRYEDPLTQIVTWSRTVLTNCFWKINVGVEYTQPATGKSYTNMILCRIPKSNQYLSAYNWKRLDAESRENYFTLQVGDIIIDGDIDEDIDEYTKGMRSSDILDKYKDLGIIKIDTISDNSDEVRNIPHYVAAQGV